MTQILTAKNAQNQLSKLIKQVNENHEPIILSSENKKAVLLSKEDWDSIKETLFIYSVEGLVESIQKADAEPIENCLPLENFEWE